VFSECGLNVQSVTTLKRVYPEGPGDLDRLTLPAQPSGTA